MHLVRILQKKNYETKMFYSVKLQSQKMAPIRHIQIGFKPQPDLIVVSINRITHTHWSLGLEQSQQKKKEKKVEKLTGTSPSSSDGYKIRAFPS